MSQTITAATTANPVVCTSAAHGLSTGGKITIVGGTGAWAAINGGWTVTWLGADTFSLPVNSAAFGALAGTPTFTPGCGIVTLQQVKSFLEITSSQEDAKLQDRIDAAVDVAQDYCDRIFALASYNPATDPDNALLDGKNLPMLWVPQWPIVAVTSLKLVQEGNNGDLLTFAANQYVVNPSEGKITLTSAATVQPFGQPGPIRPTFPDGVQNVAIAYSAGFTAIPKRLAEALIIMAAHFHLIGNTRRLGAKSINMVGGAGGGTTSFEISDIPTEARAILDRFKAVVPR